MTANTDGKGGSVLPKSLKDTDYLSISTRVRAMESKLLTRERRSRMVEARSDEEAAKVLTECGYDELSSLTPCPPGRDALPGPGGGLSGPGHGGA